MSLFTSEQSKARDKIILDAIDSVISGARDHQSLFSDPQDFFGLFNVILIVFNREILLSLIRSFNIEHDRKEFMKKIFDEIKLQVNDSVNKGMM